MRARGPSPRVTFVILGSLILSLIFVASFRNQAQSRIEPRLTTSKISALVQQNALSGPAIAQKLKNETLKAELGRAAWKLFHTTFASFPDNPTSEESAALDSYVHLFQRLYPCGECADHFRTILEKYPPQVSSRSSAAAWGCHVHNEVNKSLGKEIFDCANIGDFYDCGCGDDHEESARDSRSYEKFNIAEDEIHPVKLNREDWQRGG